MRKETLKYMLPTAHICRFSRIVLTFYGYWVCGKVNYVKYHNNVLSGVVFDCACYIRLTEYNP